MELQVPPFWASGQRVKGLITSTNASSHGVLETLLAKKDFGSKIVVVQGHL